ncbi:MAG: AMP-dependent synthetase/ligase [Comamonas sp.]|nr:AMP-dependent synthetase/ligase [Comamonas sp.]
MDSSLPPSMGQVKTLPQLLALRVKATPNGEAYREFDEGSNQWKSLNWMETSQRVSDWSQALMASGLPAGARVAILLPNGLDAMCLDQACLRCGMVPVPLHAIDNAGSIAYILKDSQASLLMLSQLQTWKQICSTGEELPDLRMVVVAQPGKQAEALQDHPDTLQVTHVSVLGGKYWLERGKIRNIALPNAPSESELAGIVYTSGTTGKPKGVMLTHCNVVSDVHAVMQRVQATEQDIFLSFLPLSHTFERTAGYYFAIATGSCVAYARSVALLSMDMKEIKPTVLISVPRIYERVYAKVQEALTHAPYKQKLFKVAVQKGWKVFCEKQGIESSSHYIKDTEAHSDWTSYLPWFVLRTLVAKPLLAQFGGRLRVAVSGGAPLSPTIAQCFLGLGLPMIQGYGMTETSPVVSANALEDNHPETVGKALPGVEVRIGDEQELQVRGSIVMKGYWNRPEDTARAFTQDRWLKTGDQAAIEDGRIRIKGRIKEIIVTSTGEKVPPNDVEQAIMVDPLFEQVFVVGEDRPFIACVTVLNQMEWAEIARSIGLDPSSESSLRHAAAERAVLARIEKQTSSFAKYAVPRAVHLVLEPWTIDNGLMTPTLKLKRKNLMAYYAQAVEQMYGKPADRWKNGTP